MFDKSACLLTFVAANDGKGEVINADQVKKADNTSTPKKPLLSFAAVAAAPAAAATAVVKQPPTKTEEAKPVAVFNTKV